MENGLVSVRRERTQRHEVRQAQSDGSEAANEDQNHSH